MIADAVRNAVDGSLTGSDDLLGALRAPEPVRAAVGYLQGWYLGAANDLIAILGGAPPV